MRSLAPAVLSLPLVLALAACGESDADPQSSSTAKRTTTSAPHPRLVVASDDGVAVVDAASLKTLDVFETESRAKLGVAGDGRHVFTMQ